MAFKMAFIEDPFRKDGAVFSRQVQRDTMDFDKVPGFMRVGTAFSESDMRSIFLHFADFLSRHLPEGMHVQTPIGTFYLSLPQDRSTNSPAESGTSAERKITLDNLCIRLRTDQSLIAKMKSSVAVQVVKAPDVRSPAVYGVENTDREGVFNGGSAGDVLHLTGEKLSFPKSDGTQGVFFVDGATGAEFRAVSYSRIGSNILNFKVPALPPGSYRLEVRTKSQGGEIRVGIGSSPFSAS